MKLQEIFDQLSSGEFSQLSIGGEPAGVINEVNYEKLIGHVNLGLTALFKRFNLKEGRLSLTLVENQTLYNLSDEEVLKIEQVLTDDETELPLNDGVNSYSVFTPSAKQLRVPKILVDGSMDKPDSLKTDGLVVVFRANHPKLVLNDVLAGPQNVDIELPDSHLQALLYYVASRVHNPIGMSNEFHAGNSYYAKYEAACQELEGEGLEVDQGITNIKLLRGGWV